MKILHVSDLHYNLGWFNWLERVAANYDLVCIAGDLLDASQPDIISEQIRTVAASIGRMSTTVAICSGNHDLVKGVEIPSALWMHELCLPHVWVEGNSFKIGGRNLLCHSWLSPLHAASEDDIWIIHLPPQGTETSRAKENNFDHGDFEFSELCKSGRGPAIALCGHIHQPRSWHDIVGRTLVLNPGESNDPGIPAHIIIDLEQYVAVRHAPGHIDEAISLPVDLRTKKILRSRTAGEIESLLVLSVSNQRAEGIHLTAAEIKETRRRLRRLAEYE